MAKPIAAERWEAARELLCWHAPTATRVAAAMGIRQCTLSGHARRQGWMLPDLRNADQVAAHEAMRKALTARFIEGDDGLAKDALARFEAATELEAQQEQGDGDGAARPSPRERAQRLNERLIELGERVLVRSSRRGYISRADADSMAAISRLAAHYEKTARSAASQHQEQEDYGDEFADVVRRVEDRIYALAEELARRMAEDDAGPQMAAADREGMGA